MMHFLKTLWGCLFVWHLKGTSDFAGADCIIAHAGGETVNGQPGKMNELLEKVVRTLHQKTGLPIIAQGELARCITDLPLVGNIPRQAESSMYIDSVVVTGIFKQICNNKGWKHPILVSYHPHLWRGKMVAEKLGMKVIIPEIEPGIYDKECSQKWMRSRWLNTPRELLCRILWLLQGKI